MEPMSDRERRLRLLVVLVLVAVAGWVAVWIEDDPTEPFARPLGNVGGMIREGSFIRFGAVVLRNTSDSPILLLDARPVFSEHVDVSNVRISMGGPALGSAADEHAADAVDVRGFRLPPSRGEEDPPYGISLELRLDPGEERGFTVGMDVTYLDGFRVRTERVPNIHVLCRWVEGATGPCEPFDGIDPRFPDAEELLERLSV